MYDTPNAPRNNPQQIDAMSQVSAQVAARPLFALGAAVAAGFILGSMDSQDDRGAAQQANWQGYSGARPYTGRSQSSSDLLAPVRDEIEQIRAAAMVVAKQKLYEMLPWSSSKSQRSGYTPRANQGLHDPNAGRDYIKTYHPPDEQQEM